MTLGISIGLAVGICFITINNLILKARGIKSRRFEMLMNQAKFGQNGMISKLNNSEFKFFLTGSQYFGCQTKDSDIDFFCQYSNNVKLFLDRLGFEEIGNEYLEDDHIRYVMRHEFLNIDVQLVNDAMLKNIAQEFLMKRPQLYRCTGEVAKANLWRLAYEYAKTVKFPQEVISETKFKLSKVEESDFCVPNNHKAVLEEWQNGEVVFAWTIDVFSELWELLGEKFIIHKC